MNRVRNRDTRINHNIDPLVRTRKLNHAAGGGEIGRVLVVVELEECRIFPEDFHGRAVEIPAEEVGGVAADGYVGHVAPVCGGDGLRNLGDETAGWFVDTAVVEGEGVGGWRSGVVAVVHYAFDVVWTGIFGTGFLGNGADPE